MRLASPTVVQSRFPRAWKLGAGWVGAPGRALDASGDVALFVGEVLRYLGFTLKNYRKEVLRLIAEIGMGTGAMAAVGGTVAIIGFVTLSAGSLIAIQGFASLGNIGVEAFTGFFAALANVRGGANRNWHCFSRDRRGRCYSAIGRHADQRGD